LPIVQEKRGDKRKALRGKLQSKKARGSSEGQAEGMTVMKRTGTQTQRIGPNQKTPPQRRAKKGEVCMPVPRPSSRAMQNCRTSEEGGGFYPLHRPEKKK